MTLDRGYPMIYGLYSYGTIKLWPYIVVALDRYRMIYGLYSYVRLGPRIPHGLWPVDYGRGPADYLIKSHL